MSKDRPTTTDHPKAPTEPFVVDDLIIQPSSLDGLLTKDITNSGSFDVRGAIWATTFGKLLNALPIPGMLLDESSTIMAVNQACGKICPQYETMLSTRFSRLFSSPSNGGSIQSIVERVFATRKPTVIRTSLRIRAEEAMWCRMTFRSIRIGLERFLLLLIEESSSERNQLSLDQKRQAELQRSRQELERRLKELKGRIAELSPAEKQQRNRVTETRRTEGPMKGITNAIEGQLRELKEEIMIRLRLSLQPLIDQLKAEANSESGRQLLKALDYHLANVLSSLGGKPVRELALLTPREIQVCNLVASGLTSKQIAGAMKVTVNAVYSHRLHIRKKLGLDLSREPLATWLKFQYGL